MSARDELAATVRPVLADYGAMGTVPPEHPLGLPDWGDRLWAEQSDCPESIADALLAEGWRKMPSAEQIAEVIGKYCSGGLTLVAADAILALMDGDNE